MKKSSSIQKTGLSQEGLVHFRQIMTTTKLRHASSVRTFVDKLNSDYGFKVTSQSAFSRLENFGREGGNERLDEARLAYIAPYTYCEVLKRPYTIKELVAIAQGKLDPNEWDNQAAPVTFTKNLEMEELIRLIREEMGRRQLSEKEFAEVLKLGGLNCTPEESLQILRAILGGKRPIFYELGKIARYVQNAGQYGDIEGMARLIGVEPPIDLEDREIHNPHKVENGY
jgi:hypothetical protein